MGLLIGPTPWWQQNVIAVSPVGTTLPDGSRVICRAGGTAWIIAPVSTQVLQTWNSTTNTQVGNKPCVCDWPTLNTRLINCGFNPSDWFVPSLAQLQNPGFVCSARWDAIPLSPTGSYWSSTEFNATLGCCVTFGNPGFDDGAGPSKTRSGQVRAFRCVTY
jgi:hypothetical protein